MGKAVYKTARDGNEAELRRLIGLGGNVNWHDPRVRAACASLGRPRPSCFGRPLRRHGARPTRRHLPTACCTARGGAGCAADPPTRRAWHTRPRRMTRAAPPRARSRSSRALALDDYACASSAQRGYTALTMASGYGHEGCVRLLLEAEAIEVNATDVSLERPLPSTYHGSASMW
jgi:hypothetical protein